MSPETFKKLVALGLSHEQMAGVLEIMQDAEKQHVDAREADREKARERWRKWDARRRGKDTQTDNKRLPMFANVSKQLARERARVEDISSNLEDNKKEEEREETRAVRASSPSQAEFADFWNLFPNKVGKAAAEKAFPKARTRASFEAIMAGLHRYVAKTDDRPWCNPATFLNQARWDDAPAQVAPRQARPPPDKPKRTQATMWLDDNEGFFRNEPDTPFTRFLRANSEGDAAGHPDGDGRVVLLASARCGTGR